MSRLDEIKKQYPELNLSMFDMMVRLDTSKSYKYLPLLCKIFGQKFNPKKLLFLYRQLTLNFILKFTNRV